MVVGLECLYRKVLILLFNDVRWSLNNKGYYNMLEILK